MIQLNDRYYENLTPEKLDEILDEARKRRDDKVKGAFSPVGILANPGSK